ncbi:MAG: hypothetical protein RQ982_08840 [Gammaproteobacteria bacterium]|nr:hypothetical protein [Gammaproteobacteria bacterium]
MQQTISSQSIMLEFAAATGLSELSHEPYRYLWTDAFAVCNYLQLYHQTGEQSFLQLALKLVDQVHQILGQQRKDSGHSGWLSGLDDEQAQLHPTCGGLRIGKKLNERQPHEPVNHSLEWQQDGQYFHYLTKWMHALNRVSQVTDKSIYNQWALELAKVAHAAFTYTPTAGTKKRMFWKMSIDLSHPLVNSMGQHDPLDGLITYQQLQATAKQFNETPVELDLKTEIEDMVAMCAGHSWVSEDALGIGGLLTDAYKLVQLITIHALHESARLQVLLRDIEYSLRVFVTHNQLNLPAEYRLAFRELGLAIGLHTISRMQKQIEQQPEHFSDARQILALLTQLSHFDRIHELIESFWIESDHRSVKTWQEHADINNVMLATSLAPDGYLQL